MRVSESDKSINFDDFIGLEQSKRWERLRGWANHYVGIEIDSVADLVIQAYRAGFKRGAVTAKNGVDPNPLWNRYVSTQKGLSDSERVIPNCSVCGQKVVPFWGEEYRCPNPGVNHDIVVFD